MFLLSLLSVVFAQQQCTVFVDSTQGTNATTCGTALGAGACRTFALGLAQVNALNATQLDGCNNVTLSLAAGNYTGSGNVGVVVEPVLPANVTLRIVGDLMSTSIFDAEIGSGPIWSIKLPENQQLQMTSMTFQNGLCNCKGGALNIDSKAGSLVYIFNSFFINNVATSGGAIWMKHNGTLKLEASEFIRNFATGTAMDCNDGGGAVHAVNVQQIDIDVCKFKQNVDLNGCGGALYTTGVPDTDIDFTEFIKNQAGNGGAVYARNIAANHWDTDTFFSNTAQSVGGGLYIQNSSYQMTDSMWIFNSAQDAGALRVVDSVMVFQNINMTSNSAINVGGGLMITGRLMPGTSAFTNVTYQLDFANNTLGGNALYCSDARVQFSPPPPQADSACDMTCVTDAGQCACASCVPPTTTTKLHPTLTSSASTSMMMSSSMPSGPGAGVIVVIVLFVLVVLGGAIAGGIYYKKRLSSGRSKFLNI